jgi:hypothetical protein
MHHKKWTDMQRIGKMSFNTSTISNPIIDFPYDLNEEGIRKQPQEVMRTLIGVATF